jgi:hypothetical protein
MANTFNASGREPLGSEPDQSWGEAEKPARDWKKLTLVIGLGVLSWVATYVGMLELIEANMGELPLIHKIIIGFSVAMLMTMVVWLLDEMFKPNPFFTKCMYAFGYLFLTIISIGFGFGFYWKVLESRGEASRSAEGAVTQVQGSLVAASTRLDQLQSTLDQLTAVSTQKATTEKAAGTSCPNSKPGDGPRRKMREDDAARFSFASDFVKGRATTVKSELSALDADLLKITSDDKSTIDAKSGTRNAFMQQLGRKLDNTVTGFNAFRTDPQLKQIRTDLAERGEKTTFPDSAGKTYACPDAQLQTALRGVVRAIDQLPELEKPKIAAVEGSEATIEAFRRLTASFYGLLSFKLPPSADELRDLQKKAIQSVEAPSAASKLSAGVQPGLSKRDYVPLAIAVFVDLCLLLVSMGKSHDRLSGLLPKMRAAERGPVIQILSRFNEIHRDEQIRENFELFRHVVFDFHGDYYVAVPLDAPRKLPPAEREESRLEAQLLSNLFASFEKEKIFTRVYSPFLTSSVIRKRLARQGSKFAQSDAFRMYRFKDGAWSDIILGAVMGAAKRVEAQNHREGMRTAALELERARTIALRPQTTTPAEPTPQDPRPTQAPSWPSPRQPASTVVNDHAAFGAYAPVVAATARAPWPDNVHPLPQRMQDEPAQAPTFNSDPEVWAANSNTAPATPAPPLSYNINGALAVAYPTPAPQPAAVTAARAPQPEFTPVNDWQNTLGVVVSRVTESVTIPYTVPVTEATLPHALMQAASLRQNFASPAPVAVTPAVLELEDLGPYNDETSADEPTLQDWNDTDTQIAARYARKPTE